jgi:two-component system NtrC family sensor kinase
VLILNILQGPDKGRCFELPDHEPQMIGRSSAALPLTDHAISRAHAELTPDDGKWFINDLNSANGTFVNGRRVTRPRLLDAGDRIRTGRTIFVFGREDQAASGKQVRVARGSELESHIAGRVTSSEESMIMAVAEPTEAAVLQLRVIYEMTQLIAATVEQQPLLEQVMDLIFDNFRADRGFVLLMTADGEHADPVVVRHRTPSAEHGEAHITISHTVLQHVLRKGEALLTSNAMNDSRFAGGDSIQRFGIRSAMCAPIKYKDRVFGIIHIDSQVANYTFTADQLRLLSAIGVHTGLALANAELYAERLDRERLAAVGQTVASLSHSIKNILQGLRGGADLAELGMKKDNMSVVRGGWKIVSRNLERIYELTLNMLAYSKQRKPELEMTNLCALLNEIVDLVQHQFDQKKVALITDLDEAVPPLPLDAAGIHQAVLNLLNNALDAVEQEGGAVVLRCDFDPGESRARIRVTDNGHGIDPDLARHLYEPFKSTKGLKGTGLGLVVTKKIIEEHRGSIKLESTPEKGTTFTLFLPASTEGAAATSLADTLGAVDVAKEQPAS